MEKHIEPCRYLEYFQTIYDEKNWISAREFRNFIECDLYKILNKVPKNIFTEKEYNLLLYLIELELYKNIILIIYERIENMLYKIAVSEGTKNISKNYLAKEIFKKVFEKEIFYKNFKQNKENYPYFLGRPIALHGIIDIAKKEEVYLAIYLMVKVAQVYNFKLKIEYNDTMEFHNDYKENILYKFIK